MYGCVGELPGEAPDPAGVQLDATLGLVDPARRTPPAKPADRKVALATPGAAEFLASLDDLVDDRRGDDGDTRGPRRGVRAPARAGRRHGRAAVDPGDRPARRAGDPLGRGDATGPADIGTDGDGARQVRGRPQGTVPIPFADDDPGMAAILGELVRLARGGS
jgi:hypothetical protein